MIQPEFAFLAHQTVTIVMEAEFALNVVKPHGIHHHNCIQLWAVAAISR
jgi:hypothetical protein